MVADGAGRKLNTVADDVVLDCLDRQELLIVFCIEGEEFLNREVRHRKGIVREIDLLFFLVPLVHREIDDPAEFETVFGDQSKLFANLGARRAGKLDKGAGLAGDKETSIADPKLQLVGNLFGTLGSDVLCERAGAALFAFTPENIAEPGLPLALRP